MLEAHAAERPSWTETEQPLPGGHSRGSCFHEGGNWAKFRGLGAQEVFWAKLWPLPHILNS